MLEQYLQHFITMQLNNGVKLLPLTQLAINNKISITTKQSPFKANHGIDSNVGQILEKSFQNTIKL